MRKYQDVVLAFDSGRLGYDNGTPVFRAQVRVERQDGTAAQLYSDNGISPLSQPVLTDASGNFFFYVADGTYDIITSDPFGANPVRLEDVQIYDVAAIDAATGVILDKTVSNAKLADMPSATIKGTAVGGAPADLAPPTVKSLLALDAVENKTGSQILDGLTSGRLTSALGFTPAPVDKTLPSLTSTGTAADRTSAFNAAAAAASASGTFAIGPGSYTLSSAPTINDTTVVGVGARLTAQLPGNADLSVTNASGFWAVRNLTQGVAGYTMTPQMVAFPSGNHTRSFESAAILASVLCYDNSTYSSDGNGTVAGVETSTRDYVALDANVRVPAGLGLTHTRVWGANGLLVVGAAGAEGTADGAIIGSERRIDNYGTDSPYFQSATQKFLYSAVAAGNRKLTAGYLFQKGTVPGGAFYGFAAEASACVNFAYAVVQINGIDPQNALWGVKPDGSVEMKGATAPTTPSTGRSKTFFDTNGNLAAVFDDGRRQVFASKKPRVAHVLDIADWDSSGNNDNAAAYQLLINQAAAAGADVVATTGKFLLGSTIVLPDGHSFRGNYGAGFNTDPLKAATFYIAHSGKGFTRAGSGTAAISIVNQATFRNQPAVGTGAWTPNDHDFDYYFEDISDLRMTGIRTTNATRGIFMNGGRNNITDWLGQHFKIGLQIDWSYDTVSLDNLHLWPMWKQDAAIKAYSQDNLRSLVLKRVDNPFFTRIFSIWHQTAIDIGYYPGDGPNKPAGTVSKLKLVGADLDIGDIGYRVRPEAQMDANNGHSATWSGVSMQGRDEVIASSLALLEGTNMDIIGDAKFSNSGGNAIRMPSTATGSEVALLTRVNDWNRAGGGFPAIEVLGGHFDRLPGSRTKRGNGGAEYTGNVTVWQP